MDNFNFFFFTKFQVCGLSTLRFAHEPIIRHSLTKSIVIRHVIIVQNTSRFQTVQELAAKHEII